MAREWAFFVLIQYLLRSKYQFHSHSIINKPSKLLIYKGIATDSTPFTNWLRNVVPSSDLSPCHGWFIRAVFTGMTLRQQRSTETSSS